MERKNLFIFNIIEIDNFIEAEGESMQPISAFKTFEKNSVQNTNKHNIQKAKKNETDPLSKYPLRLLAYANEVGAALSPINSSLSTALWIPGLMYFGADVYDKYKNDNTNYAPSKSRGFEQAVFQTLSSILLPTAAVKAGQKIGCHFVHHNKSGLSSEVRKEILEFTLDSIKENRLSQNSREEMKEKLVQNFKNKLDNIGPGYSKETPLKKLSKLVIESKDPVNSLSANQDKLFTFLEKKVDEIYDVRENLINGVKNDKTPERLHKYFNKQAQKLKNTYPSNFKDKAAKLTVKKLLKEQNFKINIPATIGGFIALAVAAVPIDLFVEKVVIKKMVEPGLDYVNKNIKNPHSSKK